METSTKQASEILADYWTIEEAAKNMRISKSLLYQWTSQKKISFYRFPLGRKILIKASEMIALLENSKTLTATRN